MGVQVLLRAKDLEHAGATGKACGRREAGSGLKEQVYILNPGRRRNILVPDIENALQSTKAWSFTKQCVL